MTLTGHDSRVCDVYAGVSGERVDAHAITKTAKIIMNEGHIPITFHAT